MPEKLRWCPGRSRRCFAARCVPVKPRSHCPGVRPGASRQFTAGGPGRTGTNRDGIRVRSYIPGSATDQARLGAQIYHGMSR